MFGAGCLVQGAGCWVLGVGFRAKGSSGFRSKKGSEFRDLSVRLGLSFGV